MLSSVILEHYSYQNSSCLNWSSELQMIIFKFVHSFIYHKVFSLSSQVKWKPGIIMKGWDPSLQTEVQELDTWPGLVRTSSLPRTTWISQLSMEKGAGVMSRRQLILKVTSPAKTSFQKPKPLQINTGIGLLSPWSFRAWLVTRCLVKTWHKNTKNYSCWCLNCVYKITDWSCLLAKVPTLNWQEKRN